MIYYTRFQTRFCEIILVGNEQGISNLHLNTGEGKREFHIAEEWQHNPGFFAKAQQTITDYLDGKIKEFDLPLNLQGTEFQKKVWQKLQEIPYGRTKTYGEIARELGNSNASRAVGMANSKNPIPLIIPCHRVIGSNGKLTGFAHGLKIKDQLLQLESQNL